MGFENVPKDVISIADYLLDSKKSGLRARQGKLNGQRVIYFKGKSGINAIKREAFKAKDRNPPETREEAAKMLSKLVDHQLVIRCSKEKGTGNLEYTHERSYEEDSYYVWIYLGSQIKNYIAGILVLATIFAGVLFPLWPPIMRDGAWYLSMAGLGFLGFLFVLTIVRFIFYIITKVVASPGIWIFPNLYEDVGFFESFVPLYAWDLPPPPKVKKSKSDKKKKKSSVTTSESLKESNQDPLLEEVDQASTPTTYVEDDEHVEEIIAETK